MYAEFEALMQGVSGPVGYFLVFVFAAVPWFEFLVVIPPAIAVGLDPVAVGILAFFGNLGAIYVLVVFHGWVKRRWGRRSGQDGEGRYGRARRLWDRYGLPGLAAVSPVLTGTHLAAAVALVLGTDRRDVLVWMTLSLTAWTAVVVAVSVAGVAYLG